MRIQPVDPKLLTLAGREDWLPHLLDIAVRFTPPRVITLEQTLEWIEDDELVEVTPESTRIRKQVLDHSQREVAAKKAKKAAAEG